MFSPDRRFSRRELAGGVLAAATHGAAPARKRIAAVVTEYRFYSHADVIVGRLLGGYSPNGRRVPPRCEVVSLYTEQVPKNDMSREMASRYGFTIYPTVAEALTRGGSRLAVDGVVLVGEHGDYPVNDVGQKLYPRFELFEQIVEVYRRGGPRVPLFSDKHLSYSWEKAKRMYGEARELGIPFMAGSSIPLTVRVPDIELAYGAPLGEAVAIGYGDADAYGFHTLEVLQCMLERRRGGETGIAAVRMLEGEAVWRWRENEGRWSMALAEAALARFSSVKPGRVEANVAQPVLFLLEYRDGLRAAVYLLNGHVEGWAFAGRAGDRAEPLSTCFGLPAPGRTLPHFDGLVFSIEEMFLTGKPQYPVERTLLTTGALAFLFDSKRRKARVETPELGVHYQPPVACWRQKA